MAIWATTFSKPICLRMIGAIPKQSLLREWPYQMTYKGIGKNRQQSVLYFPCLNDAQQSASEAETIPVRKVKMDSTDS